MFDQLEKLRKRLETIEEQLSDPEVIRDQARFQALAKERAEIGPIVRAYEEYLSMNESLCEARQIVEQDEDDELKELAKEEMKRLQPLVEEAISALKTMLVPKDPLDERNIIVEIRAGAGGDEASLFAGDVLRMYQRYAERRGWKCEILDGHPNEIGGFKEVIFSIHGREVYSRLKFESGVHRVQRIPVTEAGGRIHTSTITVAVLPEAEEVDVRIDPKDLRIDVYRSSGHGGQSVNTTDSAVRITHLPTGIVVTCQDEKSQHKNKNKAMKILRSRLLEMERRKAMEERARNRRAQVGTGDRSERIRTYNFPQGRVTDHRIGLTLYRLQEILDGDLDEIIDALVLADREARLKELEEEERQ